MNQATQERPAISLMRVASSQIAAIGHCAETNTLAIQFLSKSGPGSVYHYQNFSAADYASFAGAESIGSYFGKHVKNNIAYPYEKQEPTAVAASGDSATVRLAADHAQALDINTRCYGEPLPGGQHYSRSTFKDNGDPILLNADGKRSIFCDVAE